MADAIPDQVPVVWPCIKCGYNIRGLSPAGVCPECGTAVGSSWAEPQTAAPGPIQDDRPCLNCGYNLRGLTAADVCPECANPVANSLRGDLLLYSSREYVSLLHRGVFLIQASIVGQFLVLLGFPIIGMVTAAGAAGGSARVNLMASGPTVLTGLSTIIGIVSVVGWWLFSARDPALGERDEGATARVVVRVTVMIQAAASVVSMAVSTRSGAPAPGPSGVIDILGALVGAASVIATIVWWFAAMRYLRRLAPRIPSERVFKRAGRLTWLVPVLLLVVCLGWLVDLILYYNLLEWVRKDLKTIRALQAANTGA